MKKFLLTAVLAAMTMCVNAQDLVTYDGPKFSVQHPADYKDVVDPWDDAVNEWKKSDGIRLTVWFESDCATTDQLLVLADMVKQQRETDADDQPTGWKAENPVQKGNIVTIRSVKGDIVCYEYLLNIGGSDCFKGEFTFLQSEEAQYKPLLDTILASIKKKNS